MIDEYEAAARAGNEQGALPAEYLLAFQPHEALWDEVKAIKQQFAHDYNCEQAATGQPQITLAVFRQFQSTENRIVQTLRTNARALSPFKVELKGFGSLPSHTIYINIVSKVPVLHAVKTLRQQAQKFMKMDKEHKPYFITEPHLVIARKLQPWQYEKAWLALSNASFHGRFIADHVLLLKRKEGGSYKTAGKFYFEGGCPGMQQAQLFAPTS